MNNFNVILGAILTDDVFLDFEGFQIFCKEWDEHQAKGDLIEWLSELKNLDKSENNP